MKALLSWMEEGRKKKEGRKGQHCEKESSRVGAVVDDENLDAF